MTVLMMIMDLCIIAQSLTTTMSAMQLLKSLSDCLLINPHADNENDVTFYDVTDNSSGNCKSNQNYAIEAENPNVSNNLPDIDAELDYNDLFSMPSITRTIITQLIICFAQKINLIT